VRAGAETAAAKGEEVRRDVWSGDAAGNVLDNFPHVGPAFADWNPSATEQVHSIRQHTSACVSIRQHTSAYVSIRQAPFGDRAGKSGFTCWSRVSKFTCFTICTKVQIRSQKYKYLINSTNT
jgi:hypothetical protein